MRARRSREMEAHHVTCAEKPHKILQVSTQYSMQRLPMEVRHGGHFHSDTRPFAAVGARGGNGGAPGGQGRGLRGGVLWGSARAGPGPLWGRRPGLPARGRVPWPHRPRKRRGFGLH